MRESKGLKTILTGLFVIVGIGILLAGVFIIGGKDKSFKKSVTANAVFSDVSGLGKGSNVWYSGVKVGTVKKVGFVANGVEVSFSIEEDVQQKIRKDTKVKLGSDGLIGNKIIVLYGGTPASPEIESGNTLQVENGVGTEEMMATLQGNNKNLLDITNDLKVVSKQLASGNGTVGKLLNDETIVNSLQATLAALNRAGNNAQVLTSNLSVFSKKLNNKGYLLNDLATDTTIVASLRQTVAQLNQVSLSANSLVENLNATTAKLTSNKGPVGVLLNDEKAAANLQNTFVNLEAGSKKLDDNMEAMQHNFLLRGFFKKRDKAEEKRIKDSIKNSTSAN
uniref:ABC transporter permease component n=1 Tax=uncultured bacterium BLR12 TaxID=506514 RepID=C0INF9_9BACT|nr:ABC transporter permease component [uncultured bacterium BLR12]